MRIWFQIGKLLIVISIAVSSYFSYRILSTLEDASVLLSTGKTQPATIATDVLVLQIAAVLTIIGFLCLLPHLFFSVKYGADQSAETQPTTGEEFHAALQATIADELQETWIKKRWQQLARLLQSSPTADPVLGTALFVLAIIVMFLLVFFTISFS